MWEDVPITDRGLLNSFRRLQWWSRRFLEVTDWTRSSSKKRIWFFLGNFWSTYLVIFPLHLVYNAWVLHHNIIFTMLVKWHWTSNLIWSCRLRKLVKHQSDRCIWPESCRCKERQCIKAWRRAGGSDSSTTMPQPCQCKPICIYLLRGSLSVGYVVNPWRI